MLLAGVIVVDLARALAPIPEKKKKPCEEVVGAVEAEEDGG